MAATRFGRSGNARRTIATVRIDSGTDRAVMNMKQVRASSSEAGWRSGMTHVRAHPNPVPAIHTASPGKGSRAQRDEASGRLSWKVATAPSTVVSTDPRTATHMSGT